MLQAFEDSCYIIPFTHVVLMSINDYTSIRVRTSEDHQWVLNYPNQDVRDLEIRRFRQWLTTPTNSI